jgi:hypothetical protein
MGWAKGDQVLVKFSIFWMLCGIALLTACGGNSDGAGDSNPDETQQATSEAGDEQVGTEEFGMTDEELVTAIEEVESSIATCMQDAGFEYVPIDPVTFRRAMDELTSVPGLSDEEFVAQYGYGLTTLPPTQAFGAGEENAAIVADLPDADKVAYQRTLWGDNTEATFVIMLENEDFSQMDGCTKTAIEEVFTEEQLSPNFTNPFDAQVAQDPRMVAALAEWSDCMSEAGFDYESPEDAEGELIDRFDALTGGADPATLTGSDQEALAELQGEEKAIATKDLECTEEHLEEVEIQVERDISGR